MPTCSQPPSMPPIRNPPVNPSAAKRQNNPPGRACRPCRTHKIACSKQLPCDKCIKRGSVAFCDYSDNKPSRPNTKDDARAASSGPLTPAASIVAPSCAATSPDAPEPRIVVAARGQRVYIGSTAAISFLHYLRDTLRQHAGPSAFTESHVRETMIEADSTAESSGEGPDAGTLSVLDFINAQMLVNSFLEVSSGILGLFRDGQVSRLLRRTTTTRAGPKPVPDRDELVPLHLMIAIGGQSRGADANEAEQAHRHFSHAQRLVFKDMLQDVSIELVSNFVLMAFYLFGACRRNEAALYLGIALRSATILGLHSRELDRELSPEMVEQRARVWLSLCALDTHTSALLGRPSSVSSVVRSRRPLGDLPEENEQRLCTVRANYELCLLLEDICGAVAVPETFSVATAEKFLCRLREWASALPPTARAQLRRRGTREPNVDERRDALARLHTACAYYNSVVTLMRPFLVAKIGPALRRSEPPPSTQVSSSAFEPTASSGSAAQKLAQACVKAAVHMLQMCRDAAELDLLAGNMCILQSWIFSAGLVLGYACLCRNESWHPEAREAFKLSLLVLEKHSESNTHAQRYHSILCTFFDAILAYGELTMHTEETTRQEGGVVREATAAGEQDSLPPTVPANEQLTDGFVSPSDLSATLDIPQEVAGDEPVGIAPWAPGPESMCQDPGETGFQELWEEYSSLLAPYMLTTTMASVPEQQQ